MNQKEQKVTAESTGGTDIRVPLIMGGLGFALVTGPIITNAIQYIDCASQFCLKAQETAANIGPASMCFVPCMGASLLVAAGGILIHLLGNTKG